MPKGGEMKDANWSRESKTKVRERGMEAVLRSHCVKRGRRRPARRFLKTVAGDGSWLINVRA